MARVVTSPPKEVIGDDGASIGGWWHDADTDGGRVACDVCPRHCALRPGDRGFCFVRQNRDGRMVSTTYGRSTGFCIDPIEKKPLHHFYPGTAVLSFGTAGCNLACLFCQNWTTSNSRNLEAACEVAEPETIAEAARQLGCRSVAFTYNDPIVWLEYAIDTARACRALGIKTVAVTSGYMAPEARAAFYEVMDAANIDLKAFSDDFYRKMTGGRLQPVLDTLRWVVHETDTWLEITNLVIPQANDSSAEIQRMCQWLVDELGPDVPLHFSAFHPDFKLTDRGPTPLATLLEAHEIARRAGLRYVYTGNVSDREHQATRCPGCGQVVIDRDGYELGAYQLRDGRCAACGTTVAGRFDASPGDWGGRRQPVHIASFARTPPLEAASRRPDVPAPTLTVSQEQRIFRAAGRRVAAAVKSEVAEPMSAMLADAAELSVYGAFVSLKYGGKLRSCCGYLGTSVPLDEALENAALRAAKEDPRFPPIAATELEQLDMEVWLLWGQQTVTAQGEHREAAFTIGRHGLQIARGNARGLLLPSVAVDHNLDARGFLRQICLKAGLPPEAWKDDDTTLMTFEGRAIRGRLQAEELPCETGRPAETAGGAEAEVINLSAYGRGTTIVCAQTPRPQVDPDTRPPAVAGTFYPGRPEQIEAAIDELLPAAPQPESWPAALIPHAGWRFSGRLAMAVLSQVRIPPQVIVFCPNHRRAGSEWAVAPHHRWELPGCHVEADPALAQQLANAISGLKLDAAAHREEHAIEVHLPLLARLSPQVRVVGITIGGGLLPALRLFAQQMAAVLRDMPKRPLLVVSSDMNHFADEAETRRLDRLALDALERLNPARLYETVREQHISMCGMLPAVIVMETLRQLDALHRCKLVGYTTSAEASGDTHRVVGYAGMLLG